MSLSSLWRTAAFACAALVLVQSQVQAQQAKPNILVVFGDDIGQANVSAYTMGMMGYRTPIE